MEAGGESIEGQAWVARVIINRARASGKSFEAECLRPFQFSAWNKDARTRTWRERWLRANYTHKMRLRASNALQEAFKKPIDTGIRHYHAKGCNPSWARGKSPAYVIGRHMFYKGVR